MTERERALLQRRELIKRRSFHLRYQTMPLDYVQKIALSNYDREIAEVERELNALREMEK